MSATPATGDRSPLALLREPEFITLTAVRFITGLAFATIIIALALYADLFEASGVMAGLFGTAYAVVRLFVVLPMGRRIDIGNSKRWLLLGLGLNVLMLVGFTLVGTIEHVIALRGLQALGATILWVTGAAVVGEIAPDDDRGLWIGTYNQAQSVGSLGGDLVGGALLFVYGFQTTYAVLIALTVIVTAAVAVFVRDDPGTRTDPSEATGLETFGRLLRRRAVLALVVFRFGFSFGKMAVVIFLPIYARTEFGMSALLIGGILAGGKLTKGVAQGYVGAVADRIGSMHRFVFAGTVAYAIGTALIPAAGVVAPILPALSLAGPWGEITLVPAFFALFLAYSVLGVADSLRIPTSMTLFVQEGEYYNAVAGSLSLRSVSWQVGAIVGPLAVGGTLDHLSFTAGFWVAAGFIVVAGLVFLTLFEAEPPPEPDLAVAADD